MSKKAFLASGLMVFQVASVNGTKLHLFELLVRTTCYYITFFEKASEDNSAIHVPVQCTVCIPYKINTECWSILCTD